jgi:hypothetical protein
MRETEPGPSADQVVGQVIAVVRVVTYKPDGLPAQQWIRQEGRRDGI